MMHPHKGQKQKTKDKKAKTLPLRLLFPFGLLYGAILQIRNWLFDWGILKSERFPVPVISVGNITVGGTGKTPFTIYLARVLSERFSRIAIVSRGYGRAGRGVQLVAAKGQFYLTPEEAGDEPFMMARALPQSVVVVAEKRAEGIRLALEKFQADLILLDDAFQHRAVQRDLDILLINGREAWQGNFPIPAGTLREFKFNYKRADILIFTKLENEKSVPVAQEQIPFFTTSTRLSDVLDREYQIIGNIGSFQKQKVLAFSGIAHPQTFASALGKQGVRVVREVEFKDHHVFTAADLRRLQKLGQEAEASALLCTEKDMVKLQNIEWGEAPIPVYAVRLEMQVKQEERFFETVLNFLTESAGENE